MYFYNAELFNIFNTALRLIPAGCREKRDAIKFLDLCQLQEITVNESLFCHSSDTIPLVLYNELCRIMNTDLMMIMYNSSKSVSRHRNQMGLKYMFAYLWSLKHEVRHYRKRPNKMRCKQFPRYL